MCNKLKILLAVWIESMMTIIQLSLSGNKDVLDWDNML